MHQAGLHPAEAGSRLPVWRMCSPTSTSVGRPAPRRSGYLRRIRRSSPQPGGYARAARRARCRHRPDRGLGAPRRCSTTSSGPAPSSRRRRTAELRACPTTSGAQRGGGIRPSRHVTDLLLTIGLPGGSQAFAIAERLGLPEGVVADARSRLTEAQRSFEETLAIRETEGETSDAIPSGRGRGGPRGRSVWTAGRAAACSTRRDQHARAARGGGPDGGGPAAELADTAGRWAARPSPPRPLSGPAAPRRSPRGCPPPSPPPNWPRRRRRTRGGSG
jgi:hypothetical protein